MKHEWQRCHLGDWCQLHHSGWPKITTGLEHPKVEKHPYASMYIVQTMQSIQWLQVFEKKGYIPRSSIRAAKRNAFQNLFSGLQADNLSIFHHKNVIFHSFPSIRDYLAGSFWLHALQLLSWPQSLVLCGAIITCCSSGSQWQWAQEW